MHGCARGPPPEGRWGGKSNPPLLLCTCSVYSINVYRVKVNVETPKLQTK